METNNNFKVDDLVYDKQNDTYLTLKENDFKYSPNEFFENLELWEPKNDEFCIFFDNFSDEYFIGKYGTRCLVDTFGDDILDEEYYYDKKDWNNVVPFNESGIRYVNKIMEE